jgi:HSP20 family protein
MSNITPRRGTDSTLSNVPARLSNQSFLGPWEPFRLMRGLLGWDPFQDLAPGIGKSGYAFNPDFEIAETKNAYLLTADMPGISESDIDISVSGNVLSISGKREQTEKTDDTSYYCCERSYGSFSRSFTIPQGADVEHVSAEYNNGVLTVTLPKSPEVQPRKINVGVGNSTQGKKPAHA